MYIRRQGVKQTLDLSSVVISHIHVATERAGEAVLEKSTYSNERIPQY